MAAAVLVLDVGKTHAKLTLVSLEGAPAVTRVRANPPAGPALDAAGIESWLFAAMAELGELAEIVAIVPVAHGAAAALVDADSLAAPVLDYEATPPADTADAYEAERDPFERTLSPRLPGGLNLGVQLMGQESLIEDGAQILPWPQYWAFRLSGEKASEVTSLGCHTDLWFPREGTWSDMARRRGWARRFAPLRRAGEVLGRLRGEVAGATRLPPSCEVLCGLHDSNASLLAARAQSALAGRPFCLVSTGTWFVVMQSGSSHSPRLDESEGALGNVDVEGALVPTARFMGGREFAAMTGGARASHSLAEKTAACVALIGGKGPLVVEGRFAADRAFIAALAALRPREPVLRLGDADGVAIGAARLFAPHLAVRPAVPERICS